MNMEIKSEKNINEHKKTIACDNNNIHFMLNNNNIKI